MIRDFQFRTNDYLKRAKRAEYVGALNVYHGGKLKALKGAKGRTWEDAECGRLFLPDEWVANVANIYRVAKSNLKFL
jgi:hypothetical protein